MAGMNETPAGERVHIGFFGRRNAGKSSVVNAVTGQDLAVVSEVRGTTTDPVSKAMEILPLGPVVIIDTPGFDDEGTLGELRVSRTRKILNKTDIAVLVIDSAEGIKQWDRELIGLFEAKAIPYIIALNKSDLTYGCSTAADSVTAAYSADADLTAGSVAMNPAAADSGDATDSGSPSGRDSIDSGSRERSSGGPGDMNAIAAPDSVIRISALTGEGINELREKIASLRPAGDDRRLAADLISPGDFILLVVPIDKAAPKGRLILPQQQVIRDILDAGATAIVVRDTELEATLDRLGVTPASRNNGDLRDEDSLAWQQRTRPALTPALVITDSQVFGKVDSILPEEIPLTSFSILMARYKGLLDDAVRGAQAIDGLEDGDIVLIAEGCSHHRQCGDIGTVKIPTWLERHTGKKLEFRAVSGSEFPEDLTPYALVVHCGGCMLSEREVRYRTKCASDQGVPITNYGTLIAHVHGILRRSMEIFKLY